MAPLHEIIKFIKVSNCQLVRDKRVKPLKPIVSLFIDLVMMDAKLSYVLVYFNFVSIILSATLQHWYGWIYQDENEECTKVHTKSIERCLKQNQVPDYTTLKCGNLNYQNGCKLGMRRVLHVTNECVSTKCISNISGSGTCKTGEIPYNGRCHKIGSSKVCSEQYDLIPKRILQADIFGNVSCNCLASNGFIQFGEDCYSESSLKPCNPAESSQKQLIR